MRVFEFFLPKKMQRGNVVCYCSIHSIITRSSVEFLSFLSVKSLHPSLSRILSLFLTLSLFLYFSLSLSLSMRIFSWSAILFVYVHSMYLLSYLCFSALLVSLLYKSNIYFIALFLFPWPLYYVTSFFLYRDSSHSSFYLSLSPFPSPFLSFFLCFSLCFSLFLSVSPAPSHSLSLPLFHQRR